MLKSLASINYKMRILTIILTLIVFFSISISSVYAPSTMESDTPILDDTGSSAVLVVSFPIPVISSAVWDDADNGDEVLSAGDTLTITFDIPTDRLGGTGTLAKGVVDNLFSFANSIGTDYTGIWTSATVFTITIVDANAATASIGNTVSAKATLQFTGALDTTGGGTAFGDVRGVATNSTGFIFVTDEFESNVQIFNPDGTFAGALDTTGGGTAFVNPVGVVTDNDDDIIVSDNGADNVQKFNPDGTFAGAAVNPCCGAIAFVAPVGVAIDSNGNLFVSDPGAAPPNVQKFNINGFGGLVLDTSGGGTAFVNPTGVATNRTGFIFVADQGINNVQIFNPDRTFLGIVDTTGGGTPFVNPTDVTTNGTDFIFVSDNGADNVQIFNPDGTFAGTLDTTGATALQIPLGVAIDSNGGLFVSDQGPQPQIVQKFSLGIRDSTSGSLPATGGITTTGDFGVIPPCTIETAQDVDTTISSNCILTSSITAGGSVRVDSGAVMTISPTGTLNINFATKNLTVESGSGVLIQSGGTIT